MSRWWSDKPLEVIYRAIWVGLEHLGAKVAQEQESLGAAIAWKARDKRGERMQGVFRIRYEATMEDYAAIAPEASMKDLLRQAQTGKVEGMEDFEEDLTLQPGSGLADFKGNSLAYAGERKGIGKGGYTVTLFGSGDTLERKRLFFELEKILPPGIVLRKIRRSILCCQILLWCTDVQFATRKQQ